MNNRPERVASVLVEELNKLLVRELEAPGALITVTGAEVSRNLEHAKIGVSVYPSDKAAEALKALEGRRREFQHLLLRKMNIRPMPRIAFEIDRGPEKAAAVEKALQEEKEAGAGGGI